MTPKRQERMDNPVGTYASWFSKIGTFHPSSHGRAKLWTLSINQLTLNVKRRLANIIEGQHCFLRKLEVWYLRNEYFHVSISMGPIGPNLLDLRSGQRFGDIKHCGKNPSMRLYEAWSPWKFLIAMIAENSMTSTESVSRVTGFDLWSRIATVWLHPRLVLMAYALSNKKPYTWLWN